MNGLSAVFLAATMCLAAGEPASPFHPPVVLLDRGGQPVVQSGQPISPTTTCGQCHDTRFIADHCYHAAAGIDERAIAGTLPARRPWESSPGLFGRWNPFSYRFLAPPGSDKPDLGTADWIRQMGWRHVGGGPAERGWGDRPLDQRTPADAGDADGWVLDPATRTLQPWDWQASGAVELNCFLCHAARPDNVARCEELAAGRFAWSSTATLAGTGLVERGPEGWTYRREAFAPDGAVAAGQLGLAPPASGHCGLCHGQTHDGDTPFSLSGSLRDWSTATKGQVFSPQRISASAVNLEHKEQLGRPWDVHAERLLECRSCHFSLDQPAFYEPSAASRPAHLRFEPRRLTPADYLRQPSHHFAKGHAAQGTAARHLDGTMRTCADCHDSAAGHQWLPYRAAHMARLSCEACHVERVYAPAVGEIDWTLPTAVGEPRLVWQGCDGPPARAATLVAGFEPVLLPRQELDGSLRLAPYHLVSTWYWRENGRQVQPVRLADLKAALCEGDGYRPEVVAALDADGDGRLSATERVVDRPEEVQAIAGRLEAVGVVRPEIVAEVQPMGLHHGVGPKRWAVRDCRACHGRESRIGAQVVLASSVPGGALPSVVRDAQAELAGTLAVDGGGRLVFNGDPQSTGVYVIGRHRWPWVDRFGLSAVVGVLAAIAVHGGARTRIWYNRRKKGGQPQ